MASSFMSIMHLSSGTVNSITQLRLEVLDRIFFLSISTEMIETLCYKFRCFGVPVEGHTEVFCDNKSVVKNLIVPTSFLN